MKNKFQIFIMIILSTCLYFSVSINLDHISLSKSDWKSNSPNTDFTFQNNLSGIINKSNDKSEIGNVITISELNSPNPKMIFESGRTSPLTKFCESKNMLTIGIIADATCSSDIFLINKENGNFVRTQSGSIGGLSGTVSKGYFK
jgi:hypothetical protein